MPAVDVQFEFDLKPFEKGLQELGAVMSGRILHEGMEEAIAPTAQMASRLARRESGLLARAVAYRVRTYANAVVGIIGIDNKIEGMWLGRRRVPKYYGHLVEFGARPHAIGKGSDLDSAKKNTRKFYRLFIQDLREQSRQARKLAPGAGLGAKGTEKRKRQEEYFKVAASRELLRYEAAGKEIRPDQFGKQHPGARKNPFMRPAFDANRTRMIAVLTQKISQAIGSVFKK